MARKNLLQGLIGDQKAQPEGAEPPAPPAASQRPRYSRGAIGAVSQSIAELKSRAIAEIDPFLIDRGGLVDRLDDDTELAALTASIREHGQQVPVLVRPHPDHPERYQIVYGRRRVLALRDLGQPVKAMIRDLDDRELVVAQGQENTVRKDLTFIEKANFSRQMRDAGYGRKVICEALNVDKTQMSRLLQVADALGPDLIAVIGAAPAIGRDRWLKLVEALRVSGTDPDTAMAHANLAGGPTSNDRFEALLNALTLPLRRQAAAEAGGEAIVLRSDSGAEIGRLTRRRGATTVTIPHAGAGGFDEWLAANLSEIHRNWLKQHDKKKS
ncbi:plasmid partitioning protein RepB [Tropicimonas sp.]|uniref:plasmid partitioning protein RepB n=1 Tax=Tropicimonas sp. TaxID=2067044 RepID=UPI003A8A16C2